MALNRGGFVEIRRHMGFSLRYLYEHYSTSRAMQLTIHPADRGQQWPRYIDDDVGKLVNLGDGRYMCAAECDMRLW